jgi:hypothetical protein
MQLLKRKAYEANLADWAMVFFTVVLTLSTVIYTFYARKQWQTMADQLSEMKSGSTDTHNLAVAAGRQAEDTKTLAQQAEQSSRLAERTLGIFETQQRAWIALSAPPKLQPARNGVVWALRDFGNSPAFHISAKGENVGLQSQISTTQDRICREIDGGENWELLFPGELGRPRAAFVVGAPIVYVVGCVKYRDQFSSNRWTKFCYEPDSRDSNNFISCLGHNSTDADESSKSRRSN